MDDEYISYMDNGGISMRIIPKSFVESKGTEYSFNEKGLTLNKIFEQNKTGNKEPNVTDYQESTYNIDYLIDFLKMVKKSVSNNITIRIKNHEPACFIAKGDIIGTKEMKMWIAPIMDD